METISIKDVIRDGVIRKKRNSNDLIMAKTKPATKIQSRVKITGNPVVR